jgi:alpha-tubulin suppressor-like RCC1 family protein
LPLSRSVPTLVSLLVACNEVAGIDATPCAPACVDARTRLYCDERGEPQTQVCPEAASECAEPTCKRGKCSFEPALAKPCGYRDRGVCSDGFACIGPRTTLSANHHHTCLAGEDGKVWCWGENAARELGDGTAEDRGSPVSVRALPGEVIGISAGHAHTCALLRDGSIACWGSNERGQCGTGTGTEPLERPELVPLPSATFTALTAGRTHTCALSSDSTVYCWGDTSYGQAGVDPALTGNGVVAPTRVADLDSVGGIETVTDHTCAWRSRRPFFVCWGSNLDRDGESIVHKLGPGAAEMTHSALPVPVDLGRSAHDVGVGPESTYAKTAEDWVFAWGLNTRRQLGVASPDIVLAPSWVTIQGQYGAEPLAGVESVSRSAGFGQCASLFDPRVFNSSFLCWGENDNGELGLGETASGADAPIPDAVRSLPAVARDLVRGADHVCALATQDDREEIRCYGAAHLVGNGTTRNADGSVAIQWQGMPLRWDPDQVPLDVE